MQPSPPGAQLPRDVLIVEDDLILALDMQEEALRLGVATVRTAGSVREALDMIDARTPDFALLNISLGNESSIAVAERLDALNVRFGLVTGYGRHSPQLERFADRPKLIKPYAANELATMLRHWDDG
jgi:ActR/RegA family two-component response regulator